MDASGQTGAQAGDVDVLIVGGGLSGVGAAHHLKARSPEQTFLILEARQGLGGTWDLFRYPGIRSDSDMYTFGYAFRPWTDGKVFADGPSIRGYIEATAEEADILPHVRFGCMVTAAEWDSGAARWRVTARAGAETLVFTARFLIMAAGYYRYDRGYLPDFPGYADYRGAIAHPQHWPAGLDHAGKRVIVIGSGATAVTLVPAMAETAAHVTMLQRSPSYIAARPQKDGIADFLRKVLPGRAAYTLTRIKNVLLTMYFFALSRRFPGVVRRGVMKLIRKDLGPDFDVEKHFTPRYDPWDQRFCLAPDGDFFAALKGGQASIVTDEIERFVPEGIRLTSGETLEADIIVPATGLELLLMGGVAIRVDGRPFDPPAAFAYRGMMLSGLPNLAIAFGYTNASWTLKVDLTCERVCRLLNHMAAKGHDYCVAEAPEGLEGQDLLDFSSGYVRRSIASFPKQGPKPPWRTYQNYVQDMLSIRFGRLEDGVMQFRKAGGVEAPAAHAEAAE